MRRMGRSGVDRSARSSSSPYLEGGYTLGKGPSVDLLHLGHDIFDRFGHQAHEGTISRPVHCVSKTLDEWLRQRERNLLLL